MTDDVRANAPAVLASGVVLGLIVFLIAAVWSSFTITTSHPQASRTCTWSSATSPNLSCS